MLKNISFVLFLFFSVVSTAQTLTSKELIQIWKTDDITQTIKSEATYKDLKIHKDTVRLKKIFHELDLFLIKNPDDRLYIRTVMYKTLAVLEYKLPLSSKQQEELETAMKKVVLLNDEQLMSELYTLYSEQGSESLENNLFYLTKAVEIQQNIGLDYFPLIHHRFLVLSRSFYILQEYEESIKYAKKGLEMMKTPQIQLINYCVFNDLIGTSAYELNDAETTIKHYNNILDILKDNLSNYKKYEEIYKLHEIDFVAIWTAVAKGGIAKGYFLQKRYDEAVPLLTENIQSAVETQQLNDASKAQNILAQISFIKKDYQTALSLWKESSKWAETSGSEKHLIESLKGISEALFMLKQYDSAKHYSNKYHSLKDDNFKKINQSKLNSVNARIEYEKLRTKLANTNTDLQHQKNIRNLILIACIILIISGFFLYSRYRFKQNIKFHQLESQKRIAEVEAESAKIKTAQAQKQLKDFREKLKLNSLIAESLAEEKQDEISISLGQLIGSTILTEDDWQNFRHQFSMVFPSFIPVMEHTYPNISQSDIRYLCLIKLELDHKEIASALGISSASLRVTWHRLKRKLEIENDISSHQFIEEFERK